MSLYPDLRFDQAGGHGGNRGITQMVVIHATFNTASDENEAHYAEHRPDQVSAHFYNDEDSVIQALDTDVVAYGCFSMGNARSVQFELVGLDWDHDPPGAGAVTDAVMRRIAPIVARVCRQYGIPIRKIGPSDLRAGAKGICGHADVTLAWGQGDHMDPGPAFPWDRFLNYASGNPNGADMQWTDPTMPQRLGNPSVFASADPVIADLFSVLNGRGSVYVTGSVVKPPLGAQIDRIEAAAVSAAKQVDALTAVVQHLTSGGTSIDTAAVLAAVKAVGDADSAAMAAANAHITALAAQLDAAHAELDQLRSAAQAGAQAQAQALGQQG